MSLWANAASSIYPKKYIFNTRIVTVTDVVRNKPLQLRFEITNASNLDDGPLIANCESKTVKKESNQVYIDFPQDSKIYEIIAEICSEGYALGNVMGIETAKKQCEELGIKPGGEKYGKCVLELTK